MFRDKNSRTKTSATCTIIKFTLYTQMDCQKKALQAYFKERIVDV